MKEEGKIPPVVSKRNEFTPADELVENAIHFLPEQFKHPNFRKWLTTYTETTIKSVAMHFGVAASRGIEQAATLLCDPEFYETRRKRRAQWRRQMEEQEAKQSAPSMPDQPSCLAQQWDRIEWQNCPTAEQLQEQIKWSEGQVEYHRAELAKHQQSLERLRSLVPKNIRLVPPKTIQ